MFGATSAARLRLAFGLTAMVAALELAGGLVAHSLALLSDSAHVFMDVVALGIALAADVQSRRPATLRQSFGFARMEVLAALANGGLLLAVTVFIVVEAIRRFGAPELPQGGVMIAIAGIGAAVNVGIGISLLHAAQVNINVKAALFHVGSDVLGAVAVMIGGVLVLTLSIGWIDPLLSLVVAVIIVVGVVRIVREATDVLLESTPSHAQIPTVRQRLRTVTGVVDVHDLHVWTIGSGQHALSAHVLLRDGQISEATGILRDIDRVVRTEFAITHVTVQFECENCASDERIVCTQVGSGTSAQ